MGTLWSLSELTSLVLTACARTRLSPLAASLRGLGPTRLLTLLRLTVSYCVVRVAFLSFCPRFHNSSYRVGHNCVWYSQLPSWVSGGTFTPADLTTVIQNHCGTLVGRYKGQIYSWDVVNGAYVS